jgi:hypothetical protein
MLKLAYEFDKARELKEELKKLKAEMGIKEVKLFFRSEGKK